jgi:3'(2'), 5'-bisphosphate nucleotidase
MSSVGCKAVALLLDRGDVYAHPGHGTKLWDSCAPEAILEAAGARMTDMCGTPIDYRGPVGNHRGLLATAGVSHADITRRLAGLTSEWFE